MTIEEQLESVLRAEAERIDPPVTGLVSGGVARGRVLRRRHTVRVAGGAVALAAVVAVGGVVAVPLLDGDRGPVTATGGAATEPAADGARATVPDQATVEDTEREAAEAERAAAQAAAEAAERAAADRITERMAAERFAAALGAGWLPADGAPASAWPGPELLAGLPEGYGRGAAVRDVLGPESALERLCTGGEEKGTVLDACLTTTMPDGRTVHVQWGRTADDGQDAGHSIQDDVAVLAVDEEGRVVRARAWVAEPVAASTPQRRAAAVGWLAERVDELARAATDDVVP